MAFIAPLWTPIDVQTVQFCSSVNANTLSLCKAHLRLYQFDLNQQFLSVISFHEDTVLHYAVHAKNVELIKYLLPLLVYKNL